MEKFDRHDESLSLVYIGFGSKSLKLQKFSSALDDFQKASALLGKPEDHPPELDVLILFGKVIAYDNLGLKDDCLRCLNDLKSIINSENEVESPVLSYDYNDFSLEDYQEAIETTSDLCHLASLTCSKDVKEELFLVVNKMFEDVQGQLYTGQNLEFQYKLTETEGRVELCKAKWIKKIEKIARRVYKVFKKVKEVWEFVKEVDEAFNSKNNERGEC
ncbi:MAG: hypothetical protein P0S93_04950 [Candidatus Neptunochlamydia sp.]|nr:hypothetical protein [Candidatus Neptunochlamydia sp.]